MYILSMIRLFPRLKICCNFYFNSFAIRNLHHNTAAKSTQFSNGLCQFRDRYSLFVECEIAMTMCVVRSLSALMTFSLGQIWWYRKTALDCSRTILNHIWRAMRKRKIKINYNLIEEKSRKILTCKYHKVHRVALWSTEKRISVSILVYSFLCRNFSIAAKCSFSVRHVRSDTVDLRSAFRILQWCRI